MSDGTVYQIDFWKSTDRGGVSTHSVGLTEARMNRLEDAVMLNEPRHFI
jgi:hypothetical protein